jgi:hypothetical protein
MISSTETIIGALRVLARDIQTDDGVINACLNEAAERLQELTRGDFSPWTKIDYANPETYPAASTPCLVAWDAATANRNGWVCGAMTGERLQMMVNYDDFGLMWADVYTGDFEEYDDISRPSHWCCAPNFKESA